MLTPALCRLSLAGLAVVLGLGLAPGGWSAPARAQTASPAEMTFWQSIETSKDPRQYQAYLNSYPHGVFAPVAQMRIQQYGAAGTPPDVAHETPGQSDDTTTTAQQDGTTQDTGQNTGDQDADDDGPVSKPVVLEARPKRLHIGEQVSVTVQNMPKAPNGTTGVFIIVNAGAPDSVGLNTTSVPSSSDGAVAGTYVDTITPGSPYVAGPFGPGRYEVRWLTTLYNNEQRREVKARTSFSVR